MYVNAVSYSEDALLGKAMLTVKQLKALHFTERFYNLECVDYKLDFRDNKVIKDIFDSCVDYLYETGVLDEDGCYTEELVDVYAGEYSVPLFLEKLYPIF
jgi:hypothetical protein